MYRPSNLLNYTPEEIVAWARKEFDNIAMAFNESEFIRFKILHSAPKRVFEGLIVYADGTDWNPLSPAATAGDGLYRYNGTAWEFIG